MTRALLMLLALFTLLSCASEPPPAPPSNPEPAAAPTCPPCPSLVCAPCPAAPDTEPTQPPTQRRVHDVHVHTNPEAVPALLTLLDAQGIDRIVNLSGGGLTQKMEKNLLVEALTRGRVVPFYTVNWRRLTELGPRFAEEVAAELRVLVPLGVSGVKVSKSLGLGAVTESGDLLAIDDPRLDPIWAAAGELGVPVSIHTSDPRAFFEPLTPDNERFEELNAHPSWSFADPIYPRRDALLAARDRVIARHPKTTFICVHFANNPEDVDAVDLLLNTHPNAMVDISARLGEIGRHDAAKVREIFVRHKDRILFGTDFMFFRQRGGYHLIMGSGGDESAPIEEVPAFFGAHWRFLESSEASMPNPVPIQGRWDIHPLNLPPDVLDAIYRDNAERLIFTPHDLRRAAR